MTKTDKSKRSHRLRWLLLITVGLLLVQLPASTPAALAAGPCDLITDPSARGICKGVGTVVAPVPTMIGEVAGSSLVQPILQGIVRAEAEAVGNILGGMHDYLNANTAPDITASWFLEQYAIILGLSTFIMFFTGYGRMTVGVKDKDLVEVAKSGLSMAVFIVVTPLLPVIMFGVIQFTDGPGTQAFMSTAGENLKKMLSALTAEIATYDFGSAVLMPIVLLFFGLIGGVITEIMLFYREAALYIFTAFESVALAMWVGGKLTNDQFRRNTLSLIGLVLFKPIMAFTLVIGVGLIGSGGGGKPVLMGATICMMVPFIAWGAYKRIADHRFSETAIWTKMLVMSRAVTGH